MTALMETLRTAASPLLWLDDTAYTERLLAGSRAPWLDGAEYVAFRRKAHGLLRADLRAVPLLEFMRAQVEAHPVLVGAMSARNRAVYPVRTLLADAALRAHVVETVTSLRAAFPAEPLVLAIPSPRAMVSAAWRMAFGDDAPLEMGVDDIDSCAVYLAEFLRSFDICNVDGLLLEESSGAAPMTAETLELYQPALNVASHYRWDAGLRLPENVVFEGDASALQFVVGPCEIPGTPHVASLPEDFWAGSMPDVAHASKHLFATVPVQAVPESVLTRLAELASA